jgi:hypothetical protein
MLKFECINFWLTAFRGGYSRVARSINPPGIAITLVEHSQRLKPPGSRLPIRKGKNVAEVDLSLNTIGQGFEFGWAHLNMVVIPLPSAIRWDKLHDIRSIGNALTIRIPSKFTAAYQQLSVQGLKK